MSYILTFVAAKENLTEQTIKIAVPVFKTINWLANNKAAAIPIKT